MMIFDRFTSVSAAAMFAFNVEQLHGLKWAVLSDQAWANELDPFPYQLQQPIVLIDRSEDEQIEKAVEFMVTEYGGEFAGT